MSTTQPDTLDNAGQRLERVLLAENEALAGGDPEAAVRYLSEKQAAAAAFKAASRDPAPDATLAARLRDLVAENGALLRRAIDVQGRVLEIVAHAALRATPGPVCYGAGGGTAITAAALALTLRA